MWDGSRRSLRVLWTDWTPRALPDVPRDELCSFLTIGDSPEHPGVRYQVENDTQTMKKGWNFLGGLEFYFLSIVLSPL